MSGVIPQFKAGIHEGKLVFENEERYNQRIKDLEGKTVNVVIKRFAKQRTGQQNKYLWGVCYKLIAEHTGYEIEDIHNHFKTHLLKKKVGKLDSYYSTKKLDTKQMTDYIEKIRRFATEILELRIPDPNEIDYDDYVI